ncbi:hypothetical protein [Xanthocytophaga flava]|nr:hypothetical protein [Xanthocytophaga flavus]MDJ1472430.1 hypothetical protein [Xanthocytophaga flavus]
MKIKFLLSADVFSTDGIGYIDMDVNFTSMAYCGTGKAKTDCPGM